MKKAVVNRDHDLLAKYCVENSTAIDEVLSALERETHLKTLAPQMISGPLQGKFLEFLASSMRAEKILEVGTFTGYSTINLARGLAEGGQVHTFEINPELQYISQKYFELAKLKDKITQHIGDANVLIPDLAIEFDMAFLDGAKMDYPSLYPAIKSKLRSGGMLLVDNVLWGGKVALGASDHQTKMMQAFNLMVKNDKEVEMVILPFRDGLMLVRKL